MNAKRLAAVVAAIALIVGALAIRRVIDDDETTDPTATTEPTLTPSSSVVCITELQAVCDQVAAETPSLRATTEPALVTVDRLAAQTTGEVPLWITIEPFPAMVDTLRRNANRDPVDWTNSSVGATPLAIAVPAANLAPLEATCGANTWRCVVDADTWASLDVATSGAPKIGIGDADRSAGALAAVAVAAAGYFDDAGVSTNSLTADPSFGPWLRGLARSVPPSALSGGTPLRTMLTRPSAVNVAAVSAADIAQLTAANAASVGVNYPAPAMWLQAVVATPADGAAPDGLADAAGRAMRELGWEPASAAGDPLPSANTMLALRKLWQEAV